MSQQVSQTHVDRKCVQAREMLFICIKLRSDSVKLIHGISVRGCERRGCFCHRRQGVGEGPRGKGFASGIMKALSTTSFPKCPSAGHGAAKGPRDLLGRRAGCQPGEQVLGQHTAKNTAVSGASRVREAAAAAGGGSAPPGAPAPGSLSPFPWLSRCPASPVLVPTP